MRAATLWRAAAVCVWALAWATVLSAADTVVTLDIAPVFASPTDREPPLRIAAPGSRLLLIEASAEWCHIEFDDPDTGRRDGYVQTMHVAVTREETARVPRPAVIPSGDASTQGAAWVVVTSDAPIFPSPAPSAAPVRVAKAGSRLQWLDNQGDWFHVRFQDPDLGLQDGFVSRDSARLTGSGALPRLENPPPAPAHLPTPRTADKAPAGHGATPTTPRTKGRETKIRGYVTAVTSPTQFEIEDYRISHDGQFDLDVENASPEVQFGLRDIRVGVELEIRGTLDDHTGTLKAHAITVDLEQFKPQKQTAVLSQPPAGVELTAEGWRGVFLVDGQRIQVTPQTAVLFKLTSREKKLSNKSRTDREDDAFQPLRSLADIAVGMAMTYEGPRSSDGTIVADRVEFQRNDLESGERRMWESLKVVEKPFVESQSLAGDLRITSIGKFKTVPDQEVQDYVSRLGMSLVPEYQRRMADGDAAKIPFHFYVVEERTPNAFALPNGIVVLHSSMFDVLENEAQLAAVLGHEIAHAVQEHTWRQQQHRKGLQTGLAIGAIVAAAYKQPSLSNVLTLAQAAIQNGYARTLENQSDRVGLEYMVNAGFDPRQAPRVWKEMAGKYGDGPTNFFWSSHDNHATRRSYLMNELKVNYSTLEYSRLRVNEPEFREIATRVKAATSRKRKLHVTR